MNNEFEIAIRKCLLKAGLSAAAEVYTSSPSPSFGDCESVWELGNLRLRFVKDRGQLFVDVGSKFDESLNFVFDDISLFMKWEEPGGIINAESPVGLEHALKLIKQDLDKLENLFSKSKLQTTSKKINQISKAKTQTRFR